MVDDKYEIANKSAYIHINIYVLANINSYVISTVHNVSVHLWSKKCSTYFDLSRTDVRIVRVAKYWHIHNVDFGSRLVRQPLEKLVTLAYLFDVYILMTSTKKIARVHTGSVEIFIINTNSTAICGLVSPGLQFFCIPRIVSISISLLTANEAYVIHTIA